MIPVTYGYARVSKTDRDDRNLETQIRELELHGIRQEHIFTDVGSGRSMNRAGWRQLQELLREGDTIVVVWLDRISRNFSEGVAMQAELTRRGIGIVALREGIDTSDGSASAQLYQRMMLAQGAYQVESTAERIRAGLDRARSQGKRLGRPPVLTPEQVEECRRMYAETPSTRRVARIMNVSQGTVRKALKGGSHG